MVDEARWTKTRGGFAGFMLERRSNEAEGQEDCSCVHAAGRPAQASRIHDDDMAGW